MTRITTLILILGNKTLKLTTRRPACVAINVSFSTCFWRVSVRPGPLKNFWKQFLLFYFLEVPQKVKQATCDFKIAYFALPWPLKICILTIKYCNLKQGRRHVSLWDEVQLSACFWRISCDRTVSRCCDDWLLYCTHMSL